MQRLTPVSMTVAALSLLFTGEGALAQIGFTPRSGAGDVANNQLGQIYREGVGQGYSISSVNSLSLANTRASVPYVGTSSTYDNSRRLDLGVGSTGRDKPFANVSSRPAVSPYLNLFREDFQGGGDFNYQTLVRPQLQQQQVNQRFQDESQALSRRVQQISASAAYSPEGSKSQYPTGHQTVFGYYGRFYPNMARRQR